MSNRKTAKAGSLYMFASIFNKGIAFITVPIFTRVLSTGDYGVVMTYSAWVSIASVILGMSLNTSIRLSRGSECRIKIVPADELSIIFTFTLMIGLFASAAAVIICCLIGKGIHLIIVMLCILEAIFGWLITDYTYYQMMEFKYIGRTILMLLPNLLAAILSVIMIGQMQSYKYMGRIIPLAACNILIGAIVCVMVYKKRRPIINIEYLKWALKVSLPLIAHGIALNILSQSDRTMITFFRNSEETGIYSLVYSFSTLAAILTSGLEGIWMPWFTFQMNEKKYKEINTISKDYTDLICYAMIGIIMVSPEILKIMAPSDYWEGIRMLPPLVMSNFFSFAYTFYVNIEYYYEKTVFITINTVIAAVVNIVLNIIFIPMYGYVGASFTTLFSYVVSFTLHCIYARKINSETMNIRNFVIPVISMIVFTILFYLFINESIVRWIITLCFVLIVLYIKKDRIRFYIHGVNSDKHLKTIKLCKRKEGHKL